MHVKQIVQTLSAADNVKYDKSPCAGCSNLLSQKIKKIPFRKRIIYQTTINPLMQYDQCTPKVSFTGKHLRGNGRVFGHIRSIIP